MIEYPERPQLFALHYIKWLADSCTVQEIGPDAFALLVAVVTKEDDTRYQRAVNFYNVQLSERCGIGSEPALIRARKRAIDAGLLHYQQGAKRRPGWYFVTGYANDSLGKAEGIRRESAGKAQPSTPGPKPKPISLSKLRFDDEDRELSEFIYSKVLDAAPKTPERNLDKWANTIRLMREADKHSLREIRDLFVWANTDSFWRSNILSVDKLREQFASLDAKRRSKAGTSAPATVTRPAPPTPFGKRPKNDQ